MLNFRLLVLLIYIFFQHALAQTYPTKPIRLIVPYPPGGSVDLVGRTLARKMTELLGQPVVIDNKGGAGARLGVDLAAKSNPDGYTLVVATVTSMSMAINMFPKLPYDPIKSFAPISLLTKAPGIVTVNESLQVKNLKEFIELLKNKPGQINYSSLGNGSIQHFTGEYFQSMTGTQMLHVPYQGAGPELIAILGNQVQVGFEVLSSFQLQNYQNGKLKALAVASKERISSLPSVPTSAEAGLPGFEFSSWFSLMAPAGTSPQIIKKLNEETRKALSDKDVLEVIGLQGQDPSGNSPEEMALFLEADIAKWSRVMKSTNFKIE
ncbi:MAG: tripartite tricarboxylate transporter substrate binding protein [Betaproteobacteria bacterium]|jgi:tripartite-type tricarboxylate transporter receptor subunit TctC